MSDEARQTPGEPVSRDPWAPPTAEGAQPAAEGAQPADATQPAQPAQPADAAPEVSLGKPEVSLGKKEPAPEAEARDPWAPPADGAGRGGSVHDQNTVASMPGAGQDGTPVPPTAPADPWQSPAAQPTAPGYGYPAGGDAVPPPPVSPDGPAAQAALPYAAPGAGQPGYPGYPGYSGSAGYGWSQMPVQPSNGMGVTSLVLGIIAAAIFCFWPLAIILGILAIIFGAIGRGKAARGEATNPGQALAGLICGIVGVVLGVVFLVVVIVAAANDSSDDPYPYDGISASQVQGQVQVLVQDVRVG
ncbi:DUF4190 domain-containing protein [Streptomyces luteolus]|uniref:DUF4190 domain-containing protein n=1 Tax=Streptomyces luteolus TaxID=3043615 RepID=A0ABT6SYX9_9ACTN|nr:DUF4190 domain-containing protein [Streptomyces sp. B-S-A12]MDI3420814.1 DUF4190 domain-containing protein [Streptomyces sp. B-S-A12]